MFKTISKIILALLVSCFVLYANNSYADVSGDLDHYFSKLGFAGNISAGHAYEGQAAGYYTGGSAYLRSQVRDIQIVHIDAPSYRSGCGGIDLFMGGFSFVDASYLVDFLKKVMAGASGYVFTLALETYAPEILHGLQYIQQIAQNVNNANTSSCDMAEDMVGGLWPKTRASQQQICQDIGSQNNIFSDWADARQKCSTGDQFQDQINKANQDPHYSARTVVDKNLIWDAIRKRDFLTGDTELAELFMSLSGTIIVDNQGKMTMPPEISDSRALAKALLTGGKTDIYVCDEPTKCLHPSVGEITIDVKDALSTRVRALVNDLADKVHDDASITDEEKGFLESTGFPVLKFVTVAASLKLGAGAMDINDYKDAIAKDILKQYLFEALHTVATSLTGTDYDPSTEAQLTQNIQKALGSVDDIKVSSTQNIQNITALITKMQTLESIVSSNVTDHIKENLIYSGVGR